MHDLKQWGLSEPFISEASLYVGLLLARIIEQQRGQYKIICERGQFPSAVSGKFIHYALDSSEYPVVGDWVMVSCEKDSYVIHQILTRKSSFKRKAAGRTNNTQIVATNVDNIFICMALNHDFNLRRLERYLSVAWDSGAIPVVVLTKADLCDSLNERMSEVSSVALGADIIVCSNVLTNGYEILSSLIKPEITIAFIGSSGVGKSTIINHLIGYRILKTNEIREDGKGKHTTSHKQLFALPQGGIVIDTPGMRELGVDSAEFEKTFSDIRELSANCKFTNCTHTSEPGCAILAAIKENLIERGRFENYKKIQAEAIYSNMNSRQIEDEKISRMFGSKSIMKQKLREVKDKNNRR